MNLSTCRMDGCDRRAVYTTLQLCRTHYQASRRPPAKPKSTRHRTRGGYIRVKVPGHPMADSNGWAPEHRVVAWQAFGPFDPSMHVHHKNGIKTDNRPENLELLTAHAHASEHGEQRRVVDVAEAAAMYQAGATTVEIAVRFGTFPGNVSRILRGAGVRMRSFSEAQCRNDPTDDEIRSAVAASRSAADVGRRLGVSSTVAYRLMRKVGASPFPPGRPHAAIHARPEAAYAVGLLARSES